MISKTLGEWYKEVEKYASLYYELYALSLNDPRCSGAMRANYCDAAKSNWDLRDVLAHILKYGSAISPKKCDACRRNEPDHNNRLQRVYDKYQLWINGAIRNGSSGYITKSPDIHRQIVQAAISHFSGPIPGAERKWDAHNQCWYVKSQIISDEDTVNRIG